MSHKSLTTKYMKSHSSLSSLLSVAGRCLALLALAAGSLTPALAQNVITPVTVSASTTNSSSTTPVNLINTAGLLGSGAILTQTVSNNTSAFNMYMSLPRTVSTNWVKFDLGDQYELSGAAIWQFNQSSALWRGAQSFGIYTATNASNPVTNYVGAFSLNEAGGTVSEPAQLLSFSASQVRQVLITFSNTFSPATLTNVGLSKVRFLGNSSGLSLLGPVGETTIVGATLTLVVVPSGGGPYGYQWWQNGTNLLSGATNSTWTLSNLQLTNSANYKVVVTNTWGSVTSQVATITVVPVPTNNVIDPVGAVASTTYSLQQAATNLINGKGQMGSGPALTQTAGNDGSAVGMWQTVDNAVVATNWVQFDLGDQYNLTGAAVWNGNQANLLGRGIVSFGVFVSPDLATPITNYVGTFSLNRGSGNPTDPVQLFSFLTNGVRQVMFALSNAWSGLPAEDVELSEVRFLGNSVAIAIAQQPQSAYRFVGDPLTLSVTLTGGLPYGYQWWKNGTNLLAGATGASLTMLNLQVTDSGNYTVVVTNTAGSITSSVASVTVQAITDATTGLNGHWKLDETSGAVAVDSTVNGNNGTVYNGSDAQWVAGQIGGAMSLFGRDNGSNYIIIPNYPKPQVTMSFSAWVWADGANPALANAKIAGNWGTVTVGQFLLGLGAAGQLQLDVNQSTAGQVTVQEASPLPTNVWNHVAFVADGATLHLYRNGLEIGTAKYDGTLLAPTLSSLVVGARGPDAGTTALTNFWQGKLDDLALWTRGLTPNELTAVYAAGLAGQDATQAPSFMISPPTIVQQPQNSTNFVADSPTFSVVTWGTQPFSYQWWENGTNLLTGATNNPLTLNSVPATSDGFTYAVVVTNAGGSVTSAPATLRLVAGAPTTNDFSGAAGLTPYTAKTWGTYVPTNNLTTNGLLQLCNATRQTNIVVFDCTSGASGHIVAQWLMASTAGRLGMSFNLLDTATYGMTGNPFTALNTSPWSGNSWYFTNSLSIAFNVYDANASPTSSSEVALYWNGQPRTRVISSTNFQQGATTQIPIKTEITFVLGGMNVSVWIGTNVNNNQIFSNYFIAGPVPYRSRVGLAAATTSSQQFTNRVANLSVTYDQPGQTFPAPQVVHTFAQEYVQINNRAPTYKYNLPPSGSSYGRIILALTIAPPANGFDIWDRQANISLWDDSGQQIEIVRWMTPFAVAWTWYADVTDYQSVLRGTNRQMQVYIDTWVPSGTPSDGYGFLVTVDLLYYPGVPAQTAYKVQNLWNGQPNYGDPSNPISNFFTPRTPTVDPGAQRVKFKSFVTGHGQSPNSQNAAEFLQSWRLLNVNGTVYSNYLWKTDNNLNPCQPQGGTWTGSRAGWGPGCVVNGNGTGGWEPDVTAAVTPGQSALLNYTVMPYTNTTPDTGNWSRHFVGSQLISYRNSLLVPTIVYNSSNLLLNAASSNCAAVLPDLTVSNFSVQSDVSSVTVTQNPPANTVLPLGTNLVSLTGFDTLGNVTNGTISVVVVETTPPVITQCVPAQTLVPGISFTAVLPDLTGLLGASDNCSASLTVVQAPPAGTVLPLGTTSVSFQVDDGHGNTNACSTPVTVQFSLPVIAGGGQMLGNGAFQLTFSGPNGQTYKVLMSTDPTLPLAGWTVLSNGTFGATPVTFTDNDATNNPARFYLIASP